MRILAVLTLLACVACGTREPAAPGAIDDQAARDSAFVVAHGGGAPGMNGDLAFEPNGGYAVVVLSNFDPPAAGGLASFILSRLPTHTRGGAP